MSIVLLVSNVLAWTCMLSLGFLLFGALRALGLLRWRLEQLEATTPTRIGRGGLKSGRKAPDFTLPSITGSSIALRDYADCKVLLVFMQPGCGPCQRIMPELNQIHATGEVQVLVVQNGDIGAIQKWAEEHRPCFPVAVQEHFSVSKRYEIFITPFAFLIDEEGIIAARGLASSRQYLGYVISKAGHDQHDNHEEGVVPFLDKSETVDSFSS